MSLFTRRQAGKGKSAGPREPSQAQSEVVRPERDYAWLDQGESVAIKLWIPEKVDVLLSALAKDLTESLSALVRRILFVYLYGRNDYMAVVRLRAEGIDDKPSGLRFSRKPVSGAPGVERGPRGGRMPEMGKNYSDLKLWIPQKMRDDLQALANDRGVTLSQHIREVLVTELLGHLYLQEREELVRGPTDEQG